jgi:hypothetical protein
MIVYCSKEELIKFIRSEIKAWEKIGGGPNLDAYEFDPKEIDPKVLHELGYYDNVDAWVAGARMKVLSEFLAKVESWPMATKQ